MCTSYFDQSSSIRLDNKMLNNHSIAKMISEIFCISILIELRKVRSVYKRDESHFHLDKWQETAFNIFA